MPQDRLRKTVARHAPWMLAAIGVAVWLGHPLAAGGWITGHDAELYPVRQAEFSEGLRSGLQHPRWASDVAWGRGKPVFLYLPPLAYYVGASFQRAGAGVQTAVASAAFTFLILSAIFMYLFVAWDWGPPAGLAAAAVYVASPYFLGTLYVRAAVTDFSAYPFMPLAFLALRHVSSSVGLVATSVSVATLLLSSHSVSLISLPALTVWGVLAGRGRRTRAVAGIILGAGLSAFFWIPAVGERGLVQPERLVSGDNAYGDHFLEARQLIAPRWGYGVSRAGGDDDMPLSPGLVTFPLIAAAVLAARRRPEASAPAFVLTGLFVAALVFTLRASAPIWQVIPALHFLQFPWRFLSLAAVTGAAAAGPALSLLGERARTVAAVGIAILAVALVVPSARPAGRVGDDDLGPASIAASGRDTDKGEYLPAGVAPPVAPAPAFASIETGEADILPLPRGPEHAALIVKARGPATVRVEILDFPGWTASLDGAAIPHRRDPSGVILVDVPPGRHKVRLQLGDTPLRSTARGVSWLSLLALAAVAVLPLRRLV